jgi:lipopolysaccharide/colanic/teichoic acid biosynthesis glycosyltransferase
MNSGKSIIPARSVLSEFSRGTGTSIEKRLEHDLNYVQNRSFAFDLRIGAMTVLSALTNKNAY